MILLALDFLYYSAMNYELCRVYLEKWGLGGRWLKQARRQWSSPIQREDQAQATRSKTGLRGEAQSPTLSAQQTSIAW